VKSTPPTPNLSARGFATYFIVINYDFANIPAYMGFHHRVDNQHTAFAGILARGFATTFDIINFVFTNFLMWGNRNRHLQLCLRQHIGTEGLPLVSFTSSFIINWSWGISTTTSVT
jgi:hypothetical protein